MNEIVENATDIATVEIELASKLTAGGPILVKGTFNTFYQQNGVLVEGSAILKHIVLVVTRGGSHFSGPLYKDVIVFDDDITVTDRGCSGKFNFNVFDKVGFDGAGDYYIMCSIGAVTSNITLAVVDEA